MNDEQIKELYAKNTKIIDGWDIWICIIPMLPIHIFSS